ncbi:hypothetical protein BUY99_11825 [Staphylococcus gallinarum]|uniref:hypothetical protein n=1 Tax=Staphylococcus gallinarum TaxID=1293 RepID=UPI000E680AAC|nr:hypothetical protein [Staphylococcus gallinarum]RIL19585.1 hypothetical protein BUY99_11825 [Staphylococcus gallinarum]
MTYQIDNINIDGNRELTTAINDYLESNIHNQLVRNGSDDVFKEIRSYQSELKNELNNFNDYFENNEGEIIENNNFEEGYNSRTGSIESFDTLLTEYKLDKQNEIIQNNLDKLSVEAQKELQKSFDLAGMNFESSLVINQYPDIQKELLNINNNLNSLSEVYNKNLKEISLSISDDMKSYTIIAKDTSDKEEIINGDLPNISKEYDKQNKIDYSSKDNTLDNKNITNNIKANEINTEERIKNISEKYNVDIDTLNKQMSEIDSDPNESEIFSLDPDYENKSYEEYKLDLIENNLKSTERIENDISKDEVITDPFEDITNVAINKSNILEILENNTDIDFKEMDNNYEIYSMAFEKVNLESNNIDETLDEYISNRNIIDPTSYYSDTQKDIYKNLKSQEHQIMYKVMEEYGKLDPANFDPNNHFDELNDIENQVSNAKDLHSYAVNNFDNINNLNFNVGENNKLNLSVFTNDKEVYLTKDNNNEIIQNENSEIQKLKSVELEKNVIGLLPKDQQENNYKETLSRLEKNKSTLKNDLKSYMSNTKIDNVINSVKQHFENIKVRAEDIHKTFKDLGSWNTDNKFVKDINSVIEKVKDLSQKQNNKLDINDPDLLKKLEAKFKESNDYINKIENRNYQETQLKNNRIDYLSKELEILNPDKLNESNQITNHLSQLSTEDKIKLYNHSKDIESITKNLNFDEPDKIKTMIETHKITNSLESDLGKNYLNEHRKSYLTSSEKKPSVNDSLSNTTLKDYMNNSNDIIKNATRNDLKNYQARGNTEIKNINETQKANTLKNNDLLQKYNQQNSNQQQNNNIQESEVNNEKKQQVKSKGIQLG